MRLRCEHCDAQIDLDDAKTTGRKFLQIHCWMCGRSSLHEVAKPSADESTFIAEPFAPPDRPLTAARLEGSLTSQTATLDLPADKMITISVLEGASLGM